MIVTPTGSDRHYTLDFATFCDRFNKDPVFAAWLQQPHDDIRNLAVGKNWAGQGPFPMGCAPPFMTVSKPFLLLRVLMPMLGSVAVFAEHVCHI